MGGALERIRATITEKINQAIKHDEFDNDGDGKVSPEELAAQTNITVERAKEIIAELDVDGDGQLDAEEFEKLKQRIIDERLEQQQAVAAAAANMIQSPASIGDNGDILQTNISSKEFEGLKEEVNEIMELLMAVLDQTPAGKRALKQREMEKQKDQKHSRRSSKVHSRRSSKLGR